MSILCREGSKEEFVLSSVTLGENNSQTSTSRGFPDGSDGRESACNVGDLDLIPGLGISSGEENGNPLQYSCLENSVDRGAWQATISGVTKSQTGPKDTHTHTSRTRSQGRLRQKSNMNKTIKMFCEGIWEETSTLPVAEP